MKAKTVEADRTVAVAGGDTPDEYATAQARCAAAEGAYDEAAGAVRALWAIVPPPGSTASAREATAVERVAARQALPAAQAALDAAFLERAQARDTLAEVRARVLATLDAEYAGREDAALEEILDRARQLERLVGDYRRLENAHAAACGRRCPSECGESRLAGAWDPRTVGRASVADDLERQLRETQRRRAERGA